MSGIRTGGLELFARDLPAPQLARIGAMNGAGEPHACFLQHFHRSVIFFFRMRNYLRYLRMAECEPYQRLRDLRRIALLPVATDTS